MNDTNYIYCIAGAFGGKYTVWWEKFGEDINLAIWRIVKYCQIKLLPVKKRYIICNTHVHISMECQRAWCLQASLRKVCRDADLQ